MPQLSVVIPMYNEEDALALLVDRLRPVLDGLAAPYEVVAVDDGSTDDTARLLGEFRHVWPQLRVVGLRRNAGHQAALTAGLHRAHGTYVVSIDADLQDPPEKIVDMLALAQRDNLDVVYGVRVDRTTDTFFKRTTAAAYYLIMRRTIGSWVPRHAGDFRLLSRRAVDALIALPEQRPVYRLLVPSLGFPSGVVTYVRAERAAGKTKYPLGKMVRLAFDSIANFSAAPLRLATWLGLVSFAVCLLMFLGGVGAYLKGTTVPGWTSLFVAVTFLGGVQLICVGLVGEYVGRIYAAVQGRPAYYIGSDSAYDGSDAPADEISPADPVGARLG
ncbi:MAG TPA: glycosyltransferase family 2 protein [Micromonosporaceae bacterium]